MIHAAQTPSLWNKVWHAPTGPAVTQRQLATAFTEAGGVGRAEGWRPYRAGRCGRSGCSRRTSANSPNCSTSSSEPFVMDSAASQAALGLRPTPLPEAAAATVAWWRAQAEQSADRGVTANRHQP